MALMDCRDPRLQDAGGRQKTAPAFSAFTTSMWLSYAGAVAENTRMCLALCHPWRLDSGNPCWNDDLALLTKS
ncbi:hypothetical protein VZ94_02250 [Methylocucumis oryzae]|uniref:Uncharacterized protein n=1 Tax=Methylocucumis oryzae TaxID=1632867 RepID=A0A0F3IM83_9GAMM|nr:hypothetical protein VZ94_02250 [Methylocucumis oryzae]